MISSTRRSSSAPAHEGDVGAGESVGDIGAGVAEAEAAFDPPGAGSMTVGAGEYVGDDGPATSVFGSTFGPCASMNASSSKLSASSEETYSVGITVGLSTSDVLSTTNSRTSGLSSKRKFPATGSWQQSDVQNTTVQQMMMTMVTPGSPGAELLRMARATVAKVMTKDDDRRHDDDNVDDVILRMNRGGGDVGHAA